MLPMSPTHGDPPLQLLFVCVENACRSQMAEAFARHHGAARVRVYSAGSRPRGQVDAIAIEVMQERGVALSAHHSKGFAQLPAVTWDAVITMGCDEACPQVPAKRRIEWQIPDPAHQPIDTYRQVRDLVEESVKRVLEELGALPRKRA